MTDPPRRAHRLESATDRELQEWSRRRGLDRRAALEEIYRRYRDEIVTACTRFFRSPEDLDYATDAAAATFEAAIDALPTLDEPIVDLGAWLRATARLRCLEQVRIRDRDRKRTTRLPAIEPRPEEDWRAASRARRNDAERITALVVATLTNRERAICELVVDQGLAGAELAKARQTSTAQAYRDKSELYRKIQSGFGAYLLAVEGRRYCPQLAAILDRATWMPDTFTAQLRDQIVRHLETCPNCGNCPICRDRFETLFDLYRPALAPLLIERSVDRRVEQALRTIADHQPSPGLTPLPQVPTSGPPSAPSNPPPTGLPAAAPNRGARRRVVAAAAVLAVLLFGAGLVNWRVGADAGDLTAGAPSPNEPPPLTTVAAAGDTWPDLGGPWLIDQQTPTGPRTDAWDFDTVCGETPECYYRAHPHNLVVGNSGAMASSSGATPGVFLASYFGPSGEFLNTQSVLVSPMTSGTPDRPVVTKRDFIGEVAMYVGCEQQVDQFSSATVSTAPIIETVQVHVESASVVTGSSRAQILTMQFRRQWAPNVLSLLAVAGCAPFFTNDYATTAHRP